MTNEGSKLGITYKLKNGSNPAVVDQQLAEKCLKASGTEASKVTKHNRKYQKMPPIERNKVNALL